MLPVGLQRFQGFVLFWALGFGCLLGFGEATVPVAGRGARESRCCRAEELVGL